MPGLRKLIVTPGPWIQLFDSVGFEWNRYQLTIPHLPRELEGFRFLHLADVHCRPYWQSAYDDLIDGLNRHPPDLILFTGDVVDETMNPAKEIPIARRLFSSLPSKLGILGIRGNHDFLIRQASFVGTPLKFMDGQTIRLPFNGAQVEIVATSGFMREDLPADFVSTVPPKQPGVPRIVLSHYPDHIRKLESLKPDVYLAGHTHGGQVCVPGGYPIIRHDSLPWQKCTGIHKHGDTWFLVSRGLGFSDIPIRLFCPAEVAEVELRASF